MNEMETKQFVKSETLKNNLFLFDQIDQDNKIEDVIRFLEVNKMDSITVNRTETFRAEIKQKVSLDELKSASESIKNDYERYMGYVMWFNFPKDMCSYAEESMNGGGESIQMDFRFRPNI